MTRSVRIGLALCGILLAATALSCNVNEYCLNCGLTGDGGDGDGGIDGNGDGNDGNTSDMGTCVVTGNEVCDNKDNDCDNAIDEGQLPTIGDNCDNQVGECAGGIKECTAGVITCSKPPKAEICNGLDDDCDGNTDNGDPGGGAKCGSDVGECVAGIFHCSAARVAAGCNPDPLSCDTSLACSGVNCCCVSCGLDCGGANPINCPVDVTGAAESCNGKDDDCDNKFDEQIGSLGSCGGGPVNFDPTLHPDTPCQQGTLSCDGAGGTICSNSIGPNFEDCDQIDNNCDGVVDDGFNTLTDPTHCGQTCPGVVCNLPNALPACSNGNCVIAACNQGFVDEDNQNANGCEYQCTVTSNVEVCNGIDDDCNRATGPNGANGNAPEVNLPPPNNFCLTIGACQGATATCQGAAGFVCNYNNTVELDGSGNVVAQETLCDNIDNDCDGLIDEGQFGTPTDNIPNEGDDCVEDGSRATCVGATCVENPAAKNGVCQGSGTIQCHPTIANHAAVCVIDTAGGTASAEACDDQDNDCDGVVDNGANTGNLIGQDWVDIPNTNPVIQIMKYEASRPDATTTSQGAKANIACSKQDVIPASNVTHPQAEALCAAVGARLCSETEWQSTCDPFPVYPIAGPGATGFAYVEAESFFNRVAGSSPTGGGDTWTFRKPGDGLTNPSSTGLADFSGLQAIQARGDNGTVVTAGNAPANSARLDYQFNLLANTPYVVWVRVFAINSNANDIHIGLNATAPGTVNAGTPVVNTLNAWVWIKSNTVNSSATAGNHIVSLYMSEDGILVDAVAVTRQTGTTPPPFDERTWAYSGGGGTNPKIPSDQTCNGDPFDTTPGGTDQDAVIRSGLLAQCFANGPTTNDAFDMSGNVKEWALERAPGQNPLRGGSSNNETDGLTCGLNFTLADDTFFFPNVGYRCCRPKPP